MTESPEAPETGTEDTGTPEPGQLPDDHPLLRTLAAQKVTIKELKSKAAKLAEIEESQKSESEKATDRISKAEAEAASVPAKVADALKAHLVDMHGIDTEDAELFLTATEPDLLLKQVARLLGQSDKRRRTRVPREGENPTAADNPMSEFTRQLFGSNP